MTTQEKMRYLKTHGFSVSYIAKVVKCAPSTLNNWVSGATAISLRLEEDVEAAIQELVLEIEELR